ncbi:CD40L protein, partial [Tricholaema leucomelas]|nr:CD40L protein [Tricholaema leucomelas]
MNEPYSPTAPRPASGTSASTMKMFMGFLAAFMVAQTIGTTLFCLYLHMKMDKTEELLSLNEDYVFLRKVQKCQTAEGQESTLLDCEKISKAFQDLQCQDRGPSKGQPKFEMQKGEFLSATRDMPGEEEKLGLEWGFLHPPAAHLSSRAWHRGRALLQWTRTTYGPVDNDLISYEEGKLKVKEAGLYYIYSQVTFCTKAATLAPFTLSIYLYLPMEEDRLLLRGQDTHSTSNLQCDLQSIRVGGAFRLRQADMVFANVTDSLRMVYNHGNTYFGIFKL